MEPARFAATVEALRPSVDRHESSWFETLTAAAVQIAVDMVQQKGYDLVLIDCHMPVLDGFEAIDTTMAIKSRAAGDGWSKKRPSLEEGNRVTVD